MLSHTYIIFTATNSVYELHAKQERLDARSEKIIKEANEKANTILREAKEFADETMKNFRKFFSLLLLYEFRRAAISLATRSGAVVSIPPTSLASFLYSPAVSNSVPSLTPINTRFTESVPALVAFLEREGVHVPIGIDRDCPELKGRITYQKRLAAYRPDVTNADAEDAVRLYRRLMAEAKEHPGPRDSPVHEQL